MDKLANLELLIAFKEEQNLTENKLKQIFTEVPKNFLDILFTLNKNFNSVLDIQAKIQYNIKFISQITKFLNLKYTEDDIKEFALFLVPRTKIENFNTEELIKFYEEACALQINEFDDAVWYTRETNRLILLDLYSLKCDDEEIYAKLKALLKIVKANQEKYKNIKK